MCSVVWISDKRGNPLQPLHGLFFKLATSCVGFFVYIYIRAVTFPHVFGAPIKRGLQIIFIIRYPKNQICSNIYLLNYKY